MKPLPAIYCPTLNSKLVVIKIIYQHRWQFGPYATCEKGIEIVTQYHDKNSRPYIALSADGFFWLNKKHSDNGPCGPIGGTLVNSPAHLIVYCLTLGARGPKVFP